MYNLCSGVIHNYFCTQSSGLANINIVSKNSYNVNIHEACNVYFGTRTFINNLLIPIHVAGSTFNEPLSASVLRMHAAISDCHKLEFGIREIWIHAAAVVWITSLTFVYFHISSTIAVLIHILSRGQNLIIRMPKIAA